VVDLAESRDMARLTAQRLARVALVAFLEGHCCCGADNALSICGRELQSRLALAGWLEGWLEASTSLTRAQVA